MYYSLNSYIKEALLHKPTTSFSNLGQRDVSVTCGRSESVKGLKVLLFWASWLWLVEELQQKNVFPRWTEAAVADSQQNPHLIKSGAALSRADSRAGRVSFEPVRTQISVRVNVGGFLPVTITHNLTALPPEREAEQDASPPRRPSPISAPVTFDQTTLSYIGPDALFMLPVWRWQQRVVKRSKHFCGKSQLRKTLEKFEVF